MLFCTIKESEGITVMWKGDMKHAVYFYIYDCLYYRSDVVGGYCSYLQCGKALEEEIN